jgi:hypothetical protein
VISARKLKPTFASPRPRDWFVRGGPRLGAAHRVAWLGVATLCLATLVLAAQLAPDPRGLGTHEQLARLFGFRRALPPCSTLLVTGLPCVSCGMTTAFAWVVHGHWLRGLWVQPAGAALCLAVMALAAASLYMAMIGRSLRLNWDRLGPVRVSLAIVVLLLGSWVFKLATFTLK